MCNLRDNQQVQKVFNALKSQGFEVRFVGGCVRDTLLNQKFIEIDLATNAKPQQTIFSLKKHGIKSVPTGLKHGTVLAIVDRFHTYEITTLRQDISTDGRHAQVSFVDSWFLDAQRRDLTINAMSMDLDGRLYDYFNGEDDLYQGIIRFVGNPCKRIEEDYLRILRFFRFFSRFSKQKYPDSVTINCIEKNSKHLQKLSADRKRNEILKILVSPMAYSTLLIMQKIELLDYILPNVDLKKPIFKTTDELLAIISLYIKQREDYLLVAKLLNFSKLQIKLGLNTIDAYKDFNSGIRMNKLLFSYGVKAVNFMSILLFLKVNLQELKVPVFPIRGQDLIKKGYRGVQIGKLMQKAQILWVESDFNLSKFQLLEKIS